MCSYNRINGTYASENNWLLNQVLRDEWGFDGLVMSDWGAVSDRVKGIAAGLDLEMPGSNGANDALIVEAVKNGNLSEEDLDTAVINVLNLVEKFTENRQDEVFDRDKDHEKAVRAEEECIVLLKNDIIVNGVTEITEDGELLGDNLSEKGVLPLSDKEKIAVIGGFAFFNDSSLMSVSIPEGVTEEVQVPIIFPSIYAPNRIQDDRSVHDFAGQLSHFASAAGRYDNERPARDMRTSTSSPTRERSAFLSSSWVCSLLMYSIFISIASGQNLDKT